MKNEIPFRFVSFPVLFLFLSFFSFFNVAHRKSNNSFTKSISLFRAYIYYYSDYCRKRQKNYFANHEVILIKGKEKREEEKKKRRATEKREKEKGKRNIYSYYKIQL